MSNTHALCVTSFAVERSRPRPRWILETISQWLDVRD
jgi:hypothetical protein